MLTRARLLALLSLLGAAVIVVLTAGFSASAADSPSPSPVAAASAADTPSPASAPTTAAPTVAPSTAAPTPSKPVATATTPISKPTSTATSKPTSTKTVAPTTSSSSSNGSTAPVATSAPTAAANAGTGTTAQSNASTDTGQANSGAEIGNTISVPTADNVDTSAATATPTDSPTDSGSSSSSDPISTAINGAIKQGSSSPLVIALLLGAVSLLPALLVMVTAFTRIVIVLGFTRSALGTQNVPPNQVVIGLALFLTMFVMAPTISEINAGAIQPMLHGTIKPAAALKAGEAPLETFMLKQTRQKDLGLFIKLSNQPQPKNPKDLKFTTIVPAFVISELRTSFLIGFLIFIPFLVIDLVVSAALSSLGMMMLPPALISLPFKLLLFVAADGWYLVVQSLVRSFHT